MVNYQKYSQFLAILILLAVLFVFWQLIIKPYVNYLGDEYHTGSNLYKKHEALSRIVNNQDQILSKYKTIRNNRSLDKVFVSVKSGALAQAKLLGIIKRHVKKSGCTLVQSTSLGDQKNTGQQKTVGARITLLGDVAETYKLIHSLEYGWPVVQIESIDVSNERARYQYGKSKQQLRTTMELSAYVRN